MRGKVVWTVFSFGYLVDSRLQRGRLGLKPSGGWGWARRSNLVKVFTCYHPCKHKVLLGRKVGLWVKERQLMPGVC